MGALMWAGTFVLAIVAVMFPDDAVKGIASVAVVLLVTARVFEGCAYRPKEDHIGVIIRSADRRYRFVGRNQWTLILPGVEEKAAEVFAAMLRVTTYHPAIPARDGFPMDVTVNWMFQLDPRLVSFIPVQQFLSITRRAEWPGVLNAQFNAVVGRVLTRYHDTDLLTDRRQAQLEQELGEVASARLLPLGIVLNPRFGVSLQAVRHTQRVQRARESHRAAGHDGPAHVERFAPLAEYQRTHAIPAADVHALASVINGTQAPLQRVSVIPIPAAEAPAAPEVPNRVPPRAGDDHPDAPRPAA